MLSRSALLNLIILLEGYVVLSAELIAIRQSMPFVGSGAETVSIIIAAVLLPLAVGYHRGGSASERAFQQRKHFSIRKRLIWNFTVSAAFLTIGLSYLAVEPFFQYLNDVGVENRILQTSIYALLFLVTPTYLLGQTVPLITNYFRKTRMSMAAGRVLFISTAGSFLGATTSTLLLMPFLGVGMAVIFNILLLLGLILSLMRRSSTPQVVSLMVIGFVVLGLNNTAMLRMNGIVRDNQYSTIRVHEISQKENSRILELNRTGASKYAENEEHLFPYIRYIQNNFITPLLYMNEPQEILVIGAGGFVIGLDDGNHNYTFVDIDDDLKQISEDLLLKQKLGPNKTFAPQEARSFLVRDDKKYRLIIIDVYSDIHSMPPHLMTEEFYELIKSKLMDNGVLVANIVTTANFTERFSIKYDNTFRKVFGHYTRQVVQPYNPWDFDDRQYVNVLYVYQQRDYNRDTYTDNRNTLAFDRAVGAEEKDNY